MRMVCHAGCAAVNSTAQGMAVLHQFALVPVRKQCTMLYKGRLFLMCMLGFASLGNHVGDVASVTPTNNPNQFITQTN